MKSFKMYFKGSKFNLESYLERLIKKGFKRLDENGFIIFTDGIRTISLKKSQLIQEFKEIKNKSLEFEVLE